MLKRNKEAMKNQLHYFELAVDSDLKTVYSLIHERIK